MKDYTEIFAKAAEATDRYDAPKVKAAFNALPGIKCYVDDDCAYDDWFTVFDAQTLYSYLHCRYPLMLCKSRCPAAFRDIFETHHILQTELEEPMCCDEAVLRLYVSSKRIHILDERFLEGCDYSYEDERFLLFLNRPETAQHPISTHRASHSGKSYIYKGRDIYYDNRERHAAGENLLGRRMQPESGTRRLGDNPAVYGRKR